MDVPSLSPSLSLWAHMFCTSVLELIQHLRNGRHDHIVESFKSSKRDAHTIPSLDTAETKSSLLTTYWSESTLSS